MSMQDLETAFRLIANGEDAGFSGPKSEDLIRMAEVVLDLRFPPTYRRFLASLGCGHIAGAEFYGIVDDMFVGSSIPNGIWLTLNQRTDWALPTPLILVADTGLGGWHAIDTSRSDRSGESPVVEWSYVALRPLEQLDVVAEDFGAFLLREIEGRLAPGARRT